MLPEHSVGTDWFNNSPSGFGKCTETAGPTANGKGIAILAGKD